MAPKRARRARRPHVICHMAPSVDGRIVTSRWGEPSSLYSEYERTARSFDADAWMIGRISISDSVPGIGFGAFLTHSIASSRDLHWKIQNPAMSSLVSGNGPSVTIRLLPENLTRAPLELG